MARIAGRKMRVVREAVRGLWARPWLTFAGFVLGVMLAPALDYTIAALVDGYYALSPISRLSGEIVGADDRQVVVHLRASKRYAPGCQYIMLRAATIDVSGERERAVIESIDMQATGEALPPGSHDIGIWSIVPRSDGVAVIVTPLYECAGRLIMEGSVMLPIPVS